MKKMMFKYKSRSIKIFLMVFTLLLVVNFTVFGIQMKSIEDRIMSNERTKINQESIGINNTISQVGIDVLTLKNMITLVSEKEYTFKLDNPDITTKIKDLGIEWLKLKDSYTQFRVLNLEGYEVIRINQGSGSEAPVVVPDNMLQDKSEETYFSQNVDLLNDQIKISEFNLNRENDAIQLIDGEVLPVFRVITPIYTNDGNDFSKVGYIVFNVLTSSVTDPLEGSNIELVKISGDYVYSEENSDRLYGSILGNYDDTYDVINPNFNISSMNKNFDTVPFLDNGYIVTYKKINSESLNELISNLVNKDVTVENDDDILILVSRKEFITDPLFKTVYILAFCALFLVIIFSYSIALYIDRRYFIRQEVIKNYKLIANTDELTKLPNRKKCFEDLNLWYEKPEPFTLLYLDIDGFKNINDTYGHDIGDKTLVEVGTRITKFLGVNCKLYRFGGDEFLIISDLKDKESIIKFVSSIINEINLELPFPGVSKTIGMSIGIRIVNNRYKSIDSLIEEADKAMYYTKKQNKNNFDFFEE